MTFIGVIVLLHIVMQVVCVSSLPEVRYDQLYPQQIHLSYGDSPQKMIVTWSTIANTSSYAQYGHDIVNMTVTGFTIKFVDLGQEKRTQYIHHVIIDKLKPSTYYDYRVGTPEEMGVWSQVFRFKTMPLGTNWSPRFAIYGDMGYVNAQSLDDLIGDTQEDMYDAVLHIGDFAYDMSYYNGRQGDRFMRMIEPITTRIPYMTCPGNHEQHYNFTNYKHRFNMPGDISLNPDARKMFYSVDIATAHLVFISTEGYYFYDDFGKVQPGIQYRWLENDLRKAAANRKTRPWIVIFGHRPMYCSEAEDKDCSVDSAVLRNGAAAVGGYALEPLLARYGVDLAVWAHEHIYERMWPVYNGTMRPGPVPSRPYRNPRAPVHVVTGSAGCPERHDPFGPPPPFSAFRSADYGYSRLSVLNATHLYFEQVSDDKGGKIIDRFMIEKDIHGPYQ